MLQDKLLNSLTAHRMAHLLARVAFARARRPRVAQPKLPLASRLRMRVPSILRRRASSRTQSTTRPLRTRPSRAPPSADLVDLASPQVRLPHYGLGSMLTCGAVEYSDECFCSDSYSGPVTAASASDCNMPCTGDSTKTCGGGNRAQIYTNPSAPAAAAALPSGWRLSVPCAVDGPNRIFAGYDPQTVSNLTPAKCIEACLVCIFYSRLDPALANSRWPACPWLRCHLGRRYASLTDIRLS
jgi:hypothetical protein